MTGGMGGRSLGQTRLVRHAMDDDPPVDVIVWSFFLTVKARLQLWRKAVASFCWESQEKKSNMKRVLTKDLEPRIGRLKSIALLSKLQWFLNLKFGKLFLGRMNPFHKRPKVMGYPVTQLPDRKRSFAVRADCLTAMYSTNQSINLSIYW